MLNLFRKIKNAIGNPAREMEWYIFPESFVLDNKTSFLST